MGIWSTLSDVGSLLAGASTAAIAGTAWVGVSSWKKQERLKIGTRFLDDLTDTAYNYVDGLSPLVTIVNFVEIGIASYARAEHLRGNVEPYAGFRAYAQAQGQDVSMRIDQYLEKVKPARTHLHSLSIKGQVLGFNDYNNRCLRACQMLDWSFGQIEALVTAIKSSPNWNYENEAIQQTLGSILENVTSEVIKRNLEQHHTMLIDFVKSEYEKALQ